MNIFVGRNSKLLKKIINFIDVDFEVFSLDELYSYKKEINRIVLFKNIHTDSKKKL